MTTVTEINRPKLRLLDRPPEQTDSAAGAQDAGIVCHSPRKGDVVRFDGHEWVVGGVAFGPEGFRLVLHRDDRFVELARPAACEIARQPLPFPDADA